MALPPLLAELQGSHRNLHTAKAGLCEHSLVGRPATPVTFQSAMTKTIRSGLDLLCGGHLQKAERQREANMTHMHSQVDSSRGSQGAQYQLCSGHEVVARRPLHGCRPCWCRFFALCWRCLVRRLPYLPAKVHDVGAVRARCEVLILPPMF